MNDLMTLLFGSGIIGLLFQISRDLGAIKTAVDQNKETTSDHGDRIRKLEKEIWNEATI